MNEKKPKSSLEMFEEAFQKSMQAETEEDEKNKGKPPLFSPQESLVEVIGDDDVLGLTPPKS